MCRTQFYPTLAGAFEGGSFTNIEFVRGDYQMNSKQNLFYRYVNQHTEFFCSGCGGLNVAFSQLDNLIPRDMHAVGHTWVLSNRVLNEFYFMRATASDRNYMNQDYTPANVLNNVVTMPVSLGAGQYIGTQRYNFPSAQWGGNQCLWPCRTGTMTTFTEAQETVTISAGDHNWKIGGSIQYFPTHEWAASNPGTWTFGRDQFFDPLNPNFNINSLTGATQFTAAFPNVYRDIINHTYAAYVSDEWKPAAGLTLNLGLRYDVQTGVWNENHTQAEYPQPLPYVDFAIARRQEQPRTAARPRVGSAAERQVGRARRLRPCLHDDHQRHAGQRDHDAEAEQHHDHQPDVPGSVRRPRSGELRLHRAAQHQHPEQQAGRLAGQHLHDRLLAAAHG